MNNVLTWHFFVACVGGGILLGYLLTEWYYQRLIKRQGVGLEACADIIESLVDKCDQYESLLQLTAEEHTCTVDCTSTSIRSDCTLVGCRICDY